MTGEGPSARQPSGSARPSLAEGGCAVHPPSAAMRTQDGYDELYRLHFGRILRLCRALLRDQIEAEDVAQEVFIAALREWRGVERDMAWGPWLTTVAVHACHRRRKGRWWQWWRTATESFMGDDVAAALRTGEDDVADSQVRTVILRTFRSLSERQREVFVLRHVEGWSSQEVADALGVTVGSVKRHLFRGTEAFRKVLGPRR
jgi:RNA polymerase sigma-70 factor (ECF subfamily)